MLPLYDDNLIKICDYLSDKDKLMLTTTSTNMSKLKYKLLFRTKINISKIYLLPYFDNFENIKIHGNPPKFPKYVKYVHYTTYSTYVAPRVTHLKFKSRGGLTKNGIPSTVTHLIFGENFNDPIQEKIPLSVTHLTFGSRFNRPINDCIPLSVTHLSIGRYFDQGLDFRLLPNVKYFQLHKSFRRTLIKFSAHVPEIRFVD